MSGDSGVGGAHHPAGQRGRPRPGPSSAAPGTGCAASMPKARRSRRSAPAQRARTPLAAPPAAAPARSRSRLRGRRAATALPAPTPRRQPLRAEPDAQHRPAMRQRRSAATGSTLAADYAQRCMSIKGMMQAAACSTSSSSARSAMPGTPRMAERWRRKGATLHGGRWPTRSTLLGLGDGRSPTPPSRWRSTTCCCAPCPARRAWRCTRCSTSARPT